MAAVFDEVVHGVTIIRLLLCLLLCIGQQSVKRLTSFMIYYVLLVQLFDFILWLPLLVYYLLHSSLILALK